MVQITLLCTSYVAAILQPIPNKGVGRVLEIVTLLVLWYTEVASHEQSLHNNCIGQGVGQVLCGESTTNQDCNQLPVLPVPTAKPVPTLGKDDRVLNNGL